MINWPSGSLIWHSAEDVQCEQSPLELHIHHVGFGVNADSSSHTHTGRNCCCSKRRLSERRRSCRVSAKSCSRSFSRFLKTSRRSVANRRELLTQEEKKNRDGCWMFAFQSQDMVSALEGALGKLQTEHEALKLQQEKVRFYIVKKRGFSNTMT